MKQYQHPQKKVNILLVYPQLSFGVYMIFQVQLNLILTYWNELKGYGKKLNHSISFQHFITLLRLRLGFNILTIAHWYGVSEYSIRTVFTAWTRFLFCHFEDHKYIMFPEQLEFKDAVPKLFHTFKNICPSFDCAKFKCEMPRNYSQQGNHQVLII